MSSYHDPVRDTIYPTQNGSQPASDQTPSGFGGGNGSVSESGSGDGGLKKNSKKKEEKEKKEKDNWKPPLVGGPLSTNYSQAGARFYNPLPKKKDKKDKGPLSEKKKFKKEKANWMSPRVGGPSSTNYPGGVQFDELPEEKNQTEDKWQSPQLGGPSSTNYPENVKFRHIEFHELGFPDRIRLATPTRRSPIHKAPNVFC